MQPSRASADEPVRAARPAGKRRARWVRSVLRRPSGRDANLTLLLTLALALITGAGAMASGTERGRWVVVGHGIAGLGVILLVPWKSVVVRRGLRRGGAGRWASLLLVALAAGTLLAGLGYATGAVRSVAGVAGMWLHVAAALGLVPLLGWHVVARRIRPRRTDLSRRNLLRAGLVGTAAAGLYLVTGTAVALAALPGTRRRFTGSYQTGSFSPARMPTTSWLDDRPPAIDGAGYRLTVVDGRGCYQLGLADLARFDEPVRATLDCTSGWYADQDWVGAPVSSLVRDVGEARSLLVRSVTGYWRRFPVGDISRLVPATTVGGRRLSTGHGFPVRLIAPGRRGFWWVKWVDRIELQATPWWCQPPFPLT